MKEFNSMSTCTSAPSRTLSRLIPQYIEILRKTGVSEKHARWYVVRVEALIRYLESGDSRQPGPKAIAGFFTELGRKRGLKVWQFRQAVKAIQIVFADLQRLDWAREFDWGY